MTNGLFSFGRSVTYFNPVLFPSSNEYSYLVAPFWADHDIRPFGSLSYEVHGQTTSLISQVGTLISEQENTLFNGTWMLVAEWNDAPEYGSTDETVSHNLTYLSPRECLYRMQMFAVITIETSLSTVKQLSCYTYHKRSRVICSVCVQVRSNGLAQ